MVFQQRCACSDADAGQCCWPVAELRQNGEFNYPERECRGPLSSRCPVRSVAGNQHFNNGTGGDTELIDAGQRYCDRSCAAVTRSYFRHAHAANSVSTNPVSTNPVSTNPDSTNPVSVSADPTRAGPADSELANPEPEHSNAEPINAGRSSTDRPSSNRRGPRDRANWACTDGYSCTATDTGNPCR